MRKRIVTAIAAALVAAALLMAGTAPYGKPGSLRVDTSTIAQ